MRILFFTDVDGFGGHEVTLLDAISGLCASKAEYTGVMYYAANKTLEERLKSLQAIYKKLDLMPVPYKTEDWELLKGLLFSSKVNRIAEMMKKVAPDVVIVSQPAIGISVCGLSAAKLLGVKLISFVPSLSTACSRFGVSIANVLYDLLIKRVYRLPSHFITIADHVSQELINCYGIQSRNVAVIKYGVNPASIKKTDKHEARKLLGWKAGYAVIMVGRIAFKEKGHDVLIESISRHRQELNDITFYIVGSGPDEQRAIEMVNAAGLKDNVTFVPWKDDLSLVYSAADILVMPSRIEGAPLVMMEALAYGVACIGSDIPGIREILPDKFIFKKDDPECLVETLNRIRRCDCSGEIASLGVDIMSNRKISIFRDKFAEVVIGFGKDK
jgi:glycosyltransferase involved in cell wall biosynthesis